MGDLFVLFHLVCSRRESKLSACSSLHTREPGHLFPHRISSRRDLLKSRFEIACLILLIVSTCMISYLGVHVSAALSNHVCKHFFHCGHLQRNRHIPSGVCCSLPGSRTFLLNGNVKKCKMQTLGNCCAMLCLLIQLYVSTQPLLFSKNVFI